jgi:hypothetical protein
MSDIKSWSSTAASNTDASWGGMPEGMAPSAVNDNVRTQMAAHRTQWEDAEWFNWGHVPAYVSASTFTVSNSVTTVYSLGRRLKLYDASGGVSEIRYGHVITISAVSATNTKFTVSLTSGNLTSSLSSVAVSILDPTNTSFPKGAVLDAPTINTSVAGTAVAGQSDMETPSSSAIIVTPAVVKNHPGVVKYWCKVTFSGGTPSIAGASQAGGSMTDGGLGNTSVNLPITFSSTANMAPVATIISAGSAGFIRVAITSTSVINVICQDSAGNASDLDYALIVCGDL